MLLSYLELKYVLRQLVDLVLTNWYLVKTQTCLQFFQQIHQLYVLLPLVAWFAENLNALHTARKAYIQCEASKKIKNALKHQTRTATSKSWFTTSVIQKKNGEVPLWFLELRVSMDELLLGESLFNTVCLRS